jgi:hypothetical protein
MWMYTSRDVYRMLVHDGGWSPDQHQDWLSRTLTEALVRPDAAPWRAPRRFSPSARPDGLAAADPAAHAHRHANRYGGCGTCCVKFAGSECG